LRSSVAIIEKGAWYEVFVNLQFSFEIFRNGESWGRVVLAVLQFSFEILSGGPHAREPVLGPESPDLQFSFEILFGTHYWLQ